MKLLPKKLSAWRQRNLFVTAREAKAMCEQSLATGADAERLRMQERFEAFGQAIGQLTLLQAKRVGLSYEVRLTVPMLALDTAAGVNAAASSIAYEVASRLVNRHKAQLARLAAKENQTKGKHETQPVKTV